MPLDELLKDRRQSVPAESPTTDNLYTQADHDASPLADADNSNNGPRCRIGRGRPWAGCLRRHLLTSPAGRLYRRRSGIFLVFYDTTRQDGPHGPSFEIGRSGGHHGDLCFHEGKIYVAVNLGEFNRPPGHADSWVYVYEPDNLACLNKHKTPEVVHGAGGIAVHDGKFVIVGGLPEGMTENFAYEYDAAFVFRKRHTLSSGHTYLGIQTAAFSEGAWWFGCYGRPAAASIPASPPVLLKTDAALQSVNRFGFDCSLGIVPIRDGQFLVARGGMTQDKRHTGKLILALPNDREGLKLIAK